MNKLEQIRHLVYTRSHKGFVALMSAVIVGAIGITLSLSLLTIGTAVSQGSLLAEHSARARGMANACIEEALQHVWDTQTCEEEGDLTLGSDTCAFRLAPEGETGCLIEATGTAGNSSRHIRATLRQADPPLLLTSWREVAGF